MFNQIFENNNHNVFILKGNLQIVQDFVAYLKNINLWHDNSEDNVLLKFENFNINSAKELSKIFFYKPNIENRIVIVYASFISHDSQQVLLKTLEEMSSENKIYIFTDFPDQILPTIYSRVQFYEIKFENPEFKNASDFISQSESVRNELIAEYIPVKEETADDPEAKYVFMKRAIYFVDSLIAIYAIKAKTQTDDAKKYLDLIKDLMKTRKYIFNPGVSLKMIFELFVYLLPNEK